MNTTQVIAQPMQGAAQPQPNLTTQRPAAVRAASSGGRLRATAAVLSTNQGTVRQLTAATGAANAFSVGGLAVGPTDIAAAADAQITVGDPANGGYSVSSPTNTFSNV